MPHYVGSPLCYSNKKRPCAMRFREKYPHIARFLCESCGAVYANPMGTSEELKAFYDHYYDRGMYQEQQYKENQAQNIFAILNDKEPGSVAKTRKYYCFENGSGKNFLDVGCGLGCAMVFAHRAGYEVAGTEYDADAVKFCMSHIQGSLVFNCDLLEAKYPDNHFDYVLLYHVIEHLTDPRSYVREIYRILKPGGRFMIATPNIGCFAYKIYRATMHVLGRIPSIVDSLEHTVVFSKVCLRKLIEEEGFHISFHKSEPDSIDLTTILRSNSSTIRKTVSTIQKTANINQRVLAQKRVQ